MVISLPFVLLPLHLVFPITELCCLEGVSE